MCVPEQRRGNCCSAYEDNGRFICEGARYTIVFSLDAEEHGFYVAWGSKFERSVLMEGRDGRPRCPDILISTSI